MIKLSFIKKLPNGKWRVVSRKGKNLGTYDTKEEAVKRLKSIEYWKHKKASKQIDLSHLEKLTYSSIMRELNKQDPKSVLDFMKIFKVIFDTLVLNKESDPAEKSLPATLLFFSKEHDLKLSEKDQNKADDIVLNSRPLSKWERDTINDSDLRPSFAPFLDSTREDPYIAQTDKTPFIPGTGPTANIGTSFVDV